MKLFTFYITIFILILAPSSSFSQDIKITPDMYEYSEHSISGVYLCTPKHVENGDCSDVDDEYFDNLARMSLGAYEIGILEVNGKKTIAFKGPLSPGAADNLLRILDSYPEVSTLTLSSQGGSKEEAHKIAEYVRARNMTTWIPVRRMCLSACTTIFLNGTEKLIDGQLGFHTGKFFIADPYLVKDLETARETIQKAIFENDINMLKQVKLFLELDIDLNLLEAMIQARGKFLVFQSMQQLLNYDHRINYVMEQEEMSEFARNQPAENFDFHKYTRLY